MDGRGFTLAEMLLVLAVVGILAGATAVNFGDTKEGAKATVDDIDESFITLSLDQSCALGRSERSAKRALTSELRARPEYATLDSAKLAEELNTRFTEYKGSGYVGECVTTVATNTSPPTPISQAFIDITETPPQFPSDMQTEFTIEDPVEGVVLPEVVPPSEVPENYGIRYSINYLPQGISFNPSTRKVTGSSTDVTEFTVLYTATEYLTSSQTTVRLTLRTTPQTAPTGIVIAVETSNPSGTHAKLADTVTATIMLERPAERNPTVTIANQRAGVTRKQGTATTYKAEIRVLSSTQKGKVSVDIDSITYEDGTTENPLPQGTEMTIDTTAPTSPVWSKLAEVDDLGFSICHLINTARPQFGFRRLETEAKVVLYANGSVCNGEGTTVATPPNYQCSLRFAEGERITVAARQRDVAGNLSLRSRVLCLKADTIAPTAPTALAFHTPSSSPGNVLAPTFTVALGETGGIVQLFTDSACTTSVSTQHSVTDDTPPFTTDVTTNLFEGDGTDDGAYSYFALHTDQAGNASPCSTATLSYTLTTDTTPPTAPAAPNLADASDTGESTTDNITGDNTPTVTIAAAETGSTVTVTAESHGETAVTKTRIGDGDVTLPALPADGDWTITATATDQAGNISLPSAALTITLDTTKPPAPVLVGLAPEDDLGLSSTDPTTRRTYAASPRFNVIGLETAAKVVLYANGSVCNGEGTAVASSSYYQCSLYFVLGEESTVEARQKDVAGNLSPSSPVLAIRVVVRDQKIAHGTPSGFSLTYRDKFGASVALDGNTLAVGAKKDDTGGENSGAVYIFQRQADGSWQRQHKIAHGTPSNLSLLTDGEFGTSVALDGNTLAVGAAEDSTGGSKRGAVYILQKQADGSWQKQHKLAHHPPSSLLLDNSDEFGTSVALEGTTLVVGAPEDDTGGNNRGAVYIFQKQTNGSWQRQNKLAHGTPSNLSLTDGGLFGTSVALEGTTLVVGAPEDDTGGNNRGAVYIFQKQTNGSWQRQNKLAHGTPSNLSLTDGGLFGTSVALEGTTLVVGAPEDDTGGNNRGAVYIFQKDTDGVWQRQHKIAHGTSAFLDLAYFGEFGASVALDGNTLAVGAAEDYHRGGAVYIFGNW